MVLLMYDNSLEVNIYDIIYRNLYERQVSAFDNLIKKHKPIGNKLLDMCCGTGTHLSLYQELGYIVAGVDWSKSMVKQAQKNVKAAPIMLGDMRFFTPPEKYDIITCHSFSILHNTNTNDIIKTLSNFFKILKKGGLLIFDILDKKAGRPRAKEESWEEISLNADSPLFAQYGDEFEIDYDVQWNYHENQQLFNISINLSIDSQKGRTELQENMAMGAFSIDTIISYMEDIGFEVNAFSGSSQPSKKLSDNETEAIIVAIKPDKLI